MLILRRLVLGLRGLLTKSRAARDLDDELRADLETAVEQNVAGGMSPEQATRAARAEIGSLEAVKDYTRDGGWESIVETTWQDLRYAVRSFRRSPGFTAAAIGSLALGIGANTAVFSIVDATLLKPLPYRDADRLVDILEIHRPGTAEESAQSGMVRPRLEAWRAQTHIFDGIEAERPARPLSFGDSGMTIRVGQVSPGMFALLGVSPARGRTFSPQEAARNDDRVLVISDGLWKRAFGAAPDVVGRQVRLENRTVTVIGVTPPQVTFPIAHDAWLPLPAARDPRDPSSAFVGVVARLREGLTPAAAQDEVAGAAEAIRRLGPAQDPWTARVEAIDPRTWRTGALPIALIAFGAVLFVLLTACANLASLLLARTSSRHREMAVRVAIGASRRRLARQLLIESLVLTLAGGLVAVVLAVWLIPAIPSILPPGFIAFPVHEVQLDLRVLGAAIAASVLAGILSGVLPALRGSRHTVVTPLGATTGSAATPVHHRSRNVLVAAQVAFACVLLVGAGLMTSSFVRMVASDPGYRVDGLLAVPVSLSPARTTSPAAQAAFFDALLDRMRATPGVSAVTVGTPPPNELNGSLAAENPGNNPDNRSGAALFWVGRDYFRVLGIPIVAGRPLSPDDREGGELVAVIDEASARRFWPGQSALGQRVRYSPYVPWMTVVGVVGDVKTSRAGSAAASFELYMPMAQHAELRAPTLMIRAGNESSALAAVRAHVEALDAAATVRSASTVRGLYGQSLVNPRFTALAMSTFAALALVTAAIGLYAMLAYAVSRRTAELGVRIALGASRSSVRRLVSADALAPVAAGLIVGLAVGQLLSLLIASQLYEMTPHDPLTLMVVVLVFAIVGSVATYVPARRASRVDPIVALRTD
jgi:predicted permease